MMMEDKAALILTGALKAAYDLDMFEYVEGLANIEVACPESGDFLDKDGRKMLRAILDSEGP